GEGANVATFPPAAGAGLGGQTPGALCGARNAAKAEPIGPNGVAADTPNVAAPKHPPGLPMAPNAITAASAPNDAAAIAVPIAGIAAEIAGRAHAGRSRFEIRLDPPELGRIDVQLDVDSGGQGGQPRGGAEGQGARTLA